MGLGGAGVRRWPEPEDDPDPDVSALVSRFRDANEEWCPGCQDRIMRECLCGIGTTYATEDHADEIEDRRQAKANGK